MLTCGLLAGIYLVEAGMQRARLSNLRQWFGWSQVRGAYRPDIDGLRAIAVLAVIAFHASPKKVAGGFIGVDVFFVISGFLITSILLRELAEDRYSYLRFMARRIRRIFPALIVVLLAVLVAGWLLLVPEEFIDLGKQTAAGALFSANILFYLQDGYFDTASEFKPLLHLWSLGIEEQYYLVYPFVLWLCFRLGAATGRILIVLWIASFAYAIYATTAAPASAFFLLPARFWELLCGGLLAYGLRYTPAERRAKLLALGQRIGWAYWSAPLGLAMIGVGIAKTPAHEFPGYWALLPTIGTSLIILAGPTAWLNRRVLAWRPVVGVGLLSYSWYLWHWPAISFGYILSGGTPSNLYMHVAVALSLVAAILSYYFVEQPTRHLEIKPSYRYVLPLTLATALAGALVVFWQGLPERKAAAIALQGETDHKSYHQQVADRFHECEDAVFAKRALKYEGMLRCRQSQAGTDYDLILVGDSHAEHLFYGLATELPQLNIVYAISYGLPVRTNAYLEPIFKYLLRPEVHPDAEIMLTGAWALNDVTHLTTHLTSTIQSFQQRGYSVTVTDDIPSFELDPKLCKYRRRVQWHGDACVTTDRKIDLTRQALGQIMAQVESATGVNVIKSFDMFRRQDGAYFRAADDHILYRDLNHLSTAGSRYLARRLQESGQLQVFRLN